MTGRGHPVARYAVAVGLAAVALALTHFAWPASEATLSPLFLTAVVVSAWYGGLGPGLVATAPAVLISSLTGALRTAERENARLIAEERAARADAETANRAKDMLLATVSHDLRTPLQAIATWLEVLRRRGGVNDDAAAVVDAIERSLAVQTGSAPTSCGTSSPRSVRSGAPAMPAKGSGSAPRSCGGSWSRTVGQ